MQIIRNSRCMALGDKMKSLVTTLFQTEISIIYKIKYILKWIAMESNT